MLPQAERRYWHDGWQITAGLGGALGAAITLFLTSSWQSQQYLLPTDPVLLVGMAVGAIVPTLLWLPIAWATWRPYVPTKPGLDTDE